MSHRQHVVERVNCSSFMLEDLLCVLTVFPLDIRMSSFHNHHAIPYHFACCTLMVEYQRADLKPHIQNRCVPAPWRMMLQITRNVHTILFMKKDFIPDPGQLSLFFPVQIKKS